MNERLTWVKAWVGSSFLVIERVIFVYEVVVVMVKAATPSRKQILYKVRMFRESTCLIAS